MRQDMAADLFLGDALGLDDEIEGLVSAAAVMQCAGDLKAVPDLALDRHGADVDAWTDVGRGLEVAQFAATATVWISTLVGPNAVNRWLASVASRPARTVAACRWERASLLLLERVAATAATRCRLPMVLMSCG